MTGNVTPIRQRDDDLKNKPLPHNIAAEQQLLGAILINNMVFAKVSHALRSDDFYEAIHREIYEFIEHMVGKDRVASPVTLASLISEVEIPGTTGAAYLALLSSNAAPPNMAVDYARVIKEDSIKRQAFVFAEQLQRKVLTTGFEALQLIDDAEIFFAEVRPKDERGEQFVPFSKAVQEATDQATAAYQRQGVLSGLSTGLDLLDDKLGGLNRSDLIIVGGRPGSGKTSLAVNITFAVAKDLLERRLGGEKTGVVGFFSLEMPRLQIANRIMGEASKVSSSKVRKGKLTEGQIADFLDAGRRLEKLPLYIDHTGALPINQLVTRIRALKKRVGVEMVVIDYLQLVQGAQGSKKREVNRVQELTEITATLKSIAKELDVPMVALSQLGRQVDQRDDKRPKMSDLRESGSIEQDADSIIMVYREEYYLLQGVPRDGTPQRGDWETAYERARGRAELIVEKNRHGAPGSIEVGYNSVLMQFHNDVPESIANGTTPREPREKKKALKLPNNAMIAWKRLQSLVAIHSVPNDSLVGNVSKETRLVKYLLWKEKVLAEIMDPSRLQDEKACAREMESITKALGAAELIGRGGSPSEPYVWIVEKK